MEQPIQPQSQLITCRLTESNYLVWKMQVWAVVKGYSLDGYLTGEVKVPKEFLSETTENTKKVNPAYISWIRQDQLLMSWLLSSLSENILVSVVGSNTSMEVWKWLENNFASQNAAKVMQYRLQLQTMRKGNQCMRDFLNKVKSCCDLLAAAGHKIEEPEQIMYILSGLGSEYNSVLVTLTSRLAHFTLSDAHSMLLSFENRLENTESSLGNFDGTQFSVNIATHQQNRRGGFTFQGGRGRTPNQYFNGRGGRTNHRGSYRGRGGRFNNHGRSRCQICHYSNHTADKCFYRCDLNFVPSNNNAVNIANVGNNENAEDLCWYPDSGATNHVTYDLST
ncbi:hypothetical protein DH2020_001290 [Rehmannia glutinosa]|uniref:Retrotransposon Copia-like N-terminal domain-containing protein n=1 Tax=Rehmannia glutinosa TaxID=99300 RepID=A0ABR0XZA6_REHGL